MNIFRQLPYLFITCFLFLSACSSSNISPLKELEDASGSKKLYRIGEGDVLSVQVWGEPRLSGEVAVREDGMFSNPLVDDVPAAGLTLKQASKELVKRLKEYIPAASANISLIQSAPTVYYLSGSFLKSGEYRTDKSITLLQAIATGGGFAPFADESNIILIRKAGDKEKRYRLDYGSLVDGSQPNPDLKSGDIISIR